jgi:hypothetical protein
VFIRTVLRPAPVQEGGGGGGDPPPEDPVDIGDIWMFLGDSQTGGRAADGSTKAHVEAFCNIWQNTATLAALGPATPYNGLSSNPYRDGVSGRSLYGTRDQYRTRTGGTVNINTISMIWLQESGGQSTPDGQQDTVAEFKALFKAFIIEIRTNAPNAIIIYETAFSFGRENDLNRNWTLWNEALWEAVAELLAEEGITVYVVDTDTYIKALQAALVEGDVDEDEAKAIVWYPASDTQRAYHYTEVGNALIAILGYKTLGIPRNTLNLDGLTAVSSGHKAKILEVVG